MDRSRNGTGELQAGTFVGGYRIVGRLGSGGMGTVYRAVQVALERDVALKLLAPERTRDEEARCRFLQEGVLAARVTHRRLVRVLEVGQDVCGLFLALELIEGETVRARLDRDGVLPAGLAFEVADACAEVLGELHAAGILHRDIKPENVFLTPERGAVVGDLGIAQDIFGDGIRTQAGIVLGTPEYLAPEVILGERAGPAADFYALATMLFECLSGRRPVVADDVVAILRAHLEAPVPSIRSLRRGLTEQHDAFFERALAKDPARRLSGPAFRESLALLPRSCANQERRTSPVRRASRTLVDPGSRGGTRSTVPFSRLRRPTVGVGLIFGVILAALGIGRGPSGPPPSPAVTRPVSPSGSAATPGPGIDAGRLLDETAAVGARCVKASGSLENVSGSERARRRDRLPGEMSGIWREASARCLDFLRSSEQVPEPVAGRLLVGLWRGSLECVDCMDSVDSRRSLAGLRIDTPILERQMGILAATVERQLPGRLVRSVDPEWLAGFICLKAQAAWAPGSGDPKADRETYRKQRATILSMVGPCIGGLTDPGRRPRPDVTVVRAVLEACRKALDAKTILGTCGPMALRLEARAPGEPQDALAAGWILRLMANVSRDAAERRGFLARAGRCLAEARRAGAAGPLDRECHLLEQEIESAAGTVDRD